MDPSEASEGQILDLAREYTELRATLRFLGCRTGEAEERTSALLPHSGSEVDLQRLRDQYCEGKCRVAEIRSELDAL